MPTSNNYHAYTTKFDVVVSADKLDSVLGPLNPVDRPLLDEAWHALETGLLAWRTRILLAAAETAARIRNHLSDAQRADTVISLLFDQSGSMRGQKMLY